ncbi:hypothetical protein TD95_000808 [Thielaviopsis punctulata]|uniref:Annexin n=1 Tax=Thielaviopsis punctulata TaxID=72032 RepID=A0A0F4ZLW7_9PEZI|nr:hypothetical protein TD95_000808 [Thielaviopsis punctulata]
MSSLGVGSSSSRGARTSASHTRTRLPLPLDDSDNELPFLPSQSMVSHTRTRMPIDLDSDDETLPPTVINGSYIDDENSTISHRSTRRDRHEDRVRNSDRHRPRERERHHARSSHIGVSDPSGSSSAVAASTTPYPDDFTVPQGGNYNFYDGPAATPHYSQQPVVYRSEPLVQPTSYGQHQQAQPPRYHRTSPTPEAEHLSRTKSKSRTRDVSRHRNSSSKGKEVVYKGDVQGNELAVVSSGEDVEERRGRRGHEERRLSVIRAESGERKHRRHSISSKSTAPKVHGGMLGDDLKHHRSGRSHSRSRSELLLPTEKLSAISLDSSGRSSSRRRRHSSVGLVAPSPILEPYRGTWQESSPMPSPILRNAMRQSDDQIPELALTVRNEPEQPRRARFHDSKDFTLRIARALKDDRAPDTAPLIEILPGLTAEQVLELRREYRSMVTVGENKGVNVAEHIRSRLKDCDLNLGKACYAVALGPWASEAYWANFWYHGDKTRHELLIESLMGRNNSEIREIKRSFRDKRYDNSLIRCMKAELREDKFKKAVMMVLDEERMEEADSSGKLLPIDFQLVDRDVHSLHRSIVSQTGGETSMMKIVVRRSDTHLRIVMKEYENTYNSNFARDALKKCGNLVGEIIAHILNGIINKPVRDAILLHHAINASAQDPVRNELLTSRLVRFHWSRVHMEEIKRQFQLRYRIELSEALRERTTGDFGRFCRELCISRMPDSIKEIERISDLKRQYSEMEAAAAKARQDREHTKRERSRSRSRPATPY